MNQSDLQAGDVMQGHDGSSMLIVAMDGTRAYIVQVEIIGRYGSCSMGIKPLDWSEVASIERLGIKIWPEDSNE